MKIMLTGASGFVGSSLTPRLIEQGHKVIALDTQWFGVNLTPHPNLYIVKQDIRDIEPALFEGVDSVIHLANIANDPAVDLNPTLSWEVNVLASQRIAELSVKAGVKQVIYASSGSVYGVKEEEDVTEDLDLVPISIYNKTKMVAERVFLSYADKLAVHNIRPATVCGLSERMRLDVSVNMLTFQALKNKKITVFGGDQVRPNIHMEDMVRVYMHFLERRETIPSGNFNAGFENISIMDIANLVTRRVNASIEVTPSNDPRSYRQNSDKLLATGFTPLKTVNDAIGDVIDAYIENRFEEEDRFYTVKWMQKLGAS